MSLRESNSVARFETSQGLHVLLEHSAALPLVDIQLMLGTGSLHDPIGKEGLTRLTANLLRLGVRGMSGQQIEARIAALGARLQVEVGISLVRITGTVIARNVEPFLALLAELVGGPALRATDVAQRKRKTIDDLVAARDHDHSLGARHFRRALFGDHPYGREVAGNAKSLRRIKRSDVVEQHRRHYVVENALLGVAGAVEQDQLEAILDRHFSSLAHGRPPRARVRKPRLAKGRRVVVVDKPGRSQTPLFIGTLGTWVDDPQLYPLMVANTAFGGMFSGRLMQAVRVERGWSYGASSSLGRDWKREAWCMATAPGSTDAAACAGLQLELLDAWVAQGLDAKELRAAREYLANGFCFEIDTAHKRLEHRMEEALFGLQAGFYTDHPKRVRQVTREQANKAVKDRISTRDLTLVTVATASEVEQAFAALPGVTDVTVLPYDRDLPDGAPVARRAR